MEGGSIDGKSGDVVEVWVRDQVGRYAFADEVKRVGTSRSER